MESLEHITPPRKKLQRKVLTPPWTNPPNRCLVPPPNHMPIILNDKWRIHFPFYVTNPLIWENNVQVTSEKSTTLSLNLNNLSKSITNFSGRDVESSLSLRPCEEKLGFTIQHIIHNHIRCPCGEVREPITTDPLNVGQGPQISKCWSGAIPWRYMGARGWLQLIVAFDHNFPWTCKWMWHGLWPSHHKWCDAP